MRAAFLFVFALTTRTAVGCSPGPGWYPATPAEQAVNAAMVVSGRVLATKWDDATGSDVSTVAVKAFFCGCGPAQLKIFGHRGSSMCGAGVPEVGQEYTFFLCKDHESGQLSVNSFTLHTGLLGVTDDVTAAAEQECGAGRAVSECNGEVRSYGRSCKERQISPAVADVVINKQRRHLMAAAPKITKPGAETKDHSMAADPNDKCLDARYSCEHYGDCCGHGNYKKPGHSETCAHAKKFSVAGNCSAIGTHEGEM